VEDSVHFERSELDLKHKELKVYLEIKINKEKKFFADSDPDNLPHIEKALPSVHSLSIPQGLIDLDRIPADEPEFSEEELTEDAIKLLPARADFWVSDMIYSQTAQVKEKAKAKRAL
jgi:hypothetical protein